MNSMMRFVITFVLTAIWMELMEISMILSERPIHPIFRAVMLLAPIIAASLVGRWEEKK